MSFLSTGSGASAAPSAPSNPNARYNCSLSHAELLLLVDKSKEAEADKKKKDMLELITAAQKCGALPAAAAPSTAAAAESKPAAGAEKPSEKTDDAKSESKSAKQRARFAEKVKEEASIDTRDWELKYLRLKNQTEIAEARAKLEAGYASSRGYHSDDEDRRATRTRGGRKISKENAEKKVMNTPERKRAEAEIDEKERDLAKLKKSVADRIAPSPKKSVTTKVSTNDTDSSNVKALLQSELGVSLEELKLLISDKKKEPGKKKEKPDSSDSEGSDSEVDNEDDILSVARKRKPETLALPDSKSLAKSKGSKKKKIIIAFDGPLVVLKEVLEKCKIPNRKVKLGKTFQSQFAEIGERLAARLLKVTGIKMQMEGLLRDTFSYPVGERDLKTLALEILWIAENSKVRIPRAVFKE